MERVFTHTLCAIDCRRSFCGLPLAGSRVAGMPPRAAALLGVPSFQVGPGGCGWTASTPVDATPCAAGVNSSGWYAGTQRSAAHRWHRRATPGFFGGRLDGEVPRKQRQLVHCSTRTRWLRGTGAFAAHIPHHFATFWPYSVNEAAVDRPASPHGWQRAVGSTRGVVHVGSGRSLLASSPRSGRKAFVRTSTTRSLYAGRMSMPAAGGWTCPAYTLALLILLGRTSSAPRSISRTSSVVCTTRALVGRALDGRPATADTCADDRRLGAGRAVCGRGRGVRVAAAAALPLLPMWCRIIARSARSRRPSWSRSYSISSLLSAWGFCDGQHGGVQPSSLVQTDPRAHSPLPPRPFPYTVRGAECGRKARRAFAVVGAGQRRPSGWPAVPGRMAALYGRTALPWTLAENRGSSGGAGYSWVRLSAADASSLTVFCFQNSLCAALYMS